MLIVLFTYAGFEIIGLAASETENKQKNVPRAIHLTVFWLVTLYILCISILLLLVPSESLSENVSPMVTALNLYQMTWAGTAMTVILISAILSTMVAAMFGIGRMLRSLVDDRLGPAFLRDKTDVPYRGILFSGLSMMMFLYVGLFFSRSLSVFDQLRGIRVAFHLYRAHVYPYPIPEKERETGRKLPSVRISV